MTETNWPTEPEMFSIQPFTKKGRALSPTQVEVLSHMERKKMASSPHTPRSILGKDKYKKQCLKSFIRECLYEVDVGNDFINKIQNILKE